MKKFLMILGSVFAVLIVLGVIGFAVLNIKGDSLRQRKQSLCR